MMKNKIDIKKWQKFRIGDLFEIIPAKGKNSQMLIDGEDIPYIAASKENNGFNKYVQLEGFETWVSKGNCIQFIHIGDAAAGYANYQSKDFIAMSGKSSCAYNKNLNQYIGNFIAAIISNTNKGKYSFKESWAGNKVQATIIKLPADSKNNPDWNYMENYIRFIEKKAKNSLEKFNNFSDQNKKMDTTNWGEFQIKNLFEIKRPTARSQSNYEIGSIPFVASGNYNNGVLKYLKRKDNETLDKGNCITVSPVDGSSFYQDKDFLGRGGAGSSIILLYNEQLNNKNGIFIATIVRKICSKYLYNDMGSKETIAKEKIMLPITLNGQPNYEYMDKYINNITNNVKEKINCLNEV